MIARRSSGLSLCVLACLQLGCASSPAPCEAFEPAGAEAEAVIAAVDAVFAAMREHQVEALRARILPDAIIVATQAREGAPSTSRTISAEDFIAGTAGDPSVTLDERFTQTPLVRVDGSVASLWGPYELFVEGERHHCGVDVVQLVREGSDWRVSAITYSAYACE